MFTPHRRAVIAAVFAGLATISCSCAYAQDSTLRIIVPYPAGGATDLAARILANELQPRLGGTVGVENMVGSGEMLFDGLLD